MKQVILSILIVIVSFQANASILRGVINEAETAIKNAIGNAGPLGNYLLDRTANELNLLIQNAYITLRNDLDKDISKLSNTKQIFVNKMQELTKQIQSGKSELVSLIDNIVLDLNAIVGSTVLASDKLLIKRVSHLNILEKYETSYFFRVTASNIGFSDSRITSNLRTLELNGKTIKDFKLIPITNNEASIKISKSELDKLFDTKKLKVVKATLYLDYTIKKLLKNKKILLEPTFYLYLFPEVAGNIQVSYRLPLSKWVDAADEELNFTTPNHHCTSGCGGHENKVPVYPMELAVASSGKADPVIGDKKIISATNNCIFGPCGFTQVLIQPTRVLDKGTRVYSTVKCWSHPATFTLVAKVQEFKVNGEETVTQDINDLKYNTTFAIKVPDDIIIGNLSYKFSSSEEETIILGSETKRLRLLTIVEPKNFKYKEYIYQITRPDLE
jgi:hypothetical protein